MQAVQSTIKPGNTGPQVANLYAALQFLIEKGGFASLPPQELAALKDQLRSEEPSGFFKGAAVTLVHLFQIQSGLGDALGGMVEDQTADLLNQQLKKHGAFDTGTDFVVRGTVRDANGRPQSGLVVIAFDRDLRRWQELGRTGTNAEGWFEIPYRYESFLQAEGIIQPKVDLVMQVARRLENDALEPIHVHEEPKPVPPVASVDVVLPVVAEPGPTEFERATALITPLLIGQGPLIVGGPPPVVAPSRPLTVGPQPFDTSGLIGGMPLHADLRPDEINESDVAFIVRETDLGAEVVRAWAGGARLKADVLRLLGDLADARHRAMLEELCWPLGHAWHRMGWLGTLGGMLASGRAMWEAALDGGAERRWIAPLEPGSRNGLIEALTLLQSIVDVDPAFSSDALAQAMAPYIGALPRELAAKALGKFREGGDTALNELPDLAGGDSDLKTRLGTLARAFRLHGLAEGQTALIEPLMAKLEGPGTGLESLMALGSADWQGLVAATLPNESSGHMLAYRMQAGVEQQAPGSALLVRLDQGALDISADNAGALRQSMADNLETVNRLMRGGEVKAGDIFVGTFPKAAETIARIGQFNKIGITVADGGRFVQSGRTLPDQITNFGSDRPDFPAGGNGPLGVPVNPLITQAVNAFRNKFKKGLENLLNPAFVGPNPSIRAEVGIIPDFGLPPPQLPGISSPTVRGMFGDLDDCVCRPCESVTGPAAYLVDLLRALQREVLFQDGLQLLRDRRADILDLELSCENADVLVLHIDLALEQLEWLAARPGLSFDGAAARSASGWLTPTVDAAIVALFQKTIDGPIDSQLEARERRAQSSTEPPLWLVRERGGGRSWWIEPIGRAGNDWGGWRVLGMSIRRSAPSPDPRVEPAHRNPEAYRLLGDTAAVFPWSLPFVAARHERNALLQSLRVDPLRLGPLLPAYASSTPQGSAIGRLDQDALGLSAVEAAIVATPASGDAVWRGWGFDSAAAVPSIDDPASAETLTNKTPAELLHRASFLLARSGLSLEDLEAALATAFVGGYSISNREQCKTSEMRAQRGYGPNPQAIDGPALDRLHRLVRLWRRLPAWPLPTLDDALASMQAGTQGTPAVLGPGQLALLAATERARRLLGLSAQDVLALRQPLDSPATSQDWRRRHEQLSRAVARPVGEVIELLQWMGFAAAGLGATGDPLRAALDAIDGATTDLDVRLFRKLVARAADFDRLSSLRRWSDAFAQCDAPLPVLVAAQLPSLQGRQRGELRPEGASASSALTAALLSLRASLALVPEPGAQPTGPRLESALGDELLRLGWTEELVKHLGAEFGTVPQGGFGNELREALTQREYALDEMGAPSALMLKEELLALAQSSITREERYGFVLDRVVERRGTRERELAARLALALGDAPANALLLRLKSVVKSVRTLAAEQISAADLSGRAPGTTLPLFASSEVSRFATPALPDTWRARLDLIDARLAERERERVVLGAVMDWAAQRGAGWPARTVAAFLKDRLTIAPANTAPGAQPLLAVEQLLSSTFYRSTSPTPPADLMAWLETLDTVFALQTHSLAVAALVETPGLDWRPLLHPDAGVDSRGHLVHLLGLADARRLGTQALATVMDPASLVGAVVESLANRLSIDPAELERLGARAAKTTAGAATIEQLRSPTTLARLFELAQEARRLKATALQIDALLGSDLTAATAAGKALLKLHVGDREWPKQLRRLNDEGRRLRRDALMSFLEPRIQGAKDADALFERMLIDPKVQPCMETTRLKQATASVQMLIQRILEGLEPGAQASSKLRSQWGWMRAYRLWEANRKVFLYPENWLLPELRDDKSPEFRTLETRIAEDELTPSRADQAFGHFLEDVNRTAQTQVLGMFEHVDVLPNPAGTRPRVRDLLVVGRTPNPPYVHYWRQCRDFGKRWMEWSPWERVEADIQSDHVVPFVAQEAMYLAWPQIEDRDEPAGKRWKIEMAWSRFDGASWGKVNISRGEAPLVEQVPGEDRRSALALRAYVPGLGIAPRIHAYIKQKAEGTTNAIPVEDPLVRLDLKKLDFLSEEGEIPRLADLMKDVFEALPVDDRDNVEMYLHCTHKDKTLEYRGMWDAQGSQLWTAANLKKHRNLFNHRLEAGVRADVLTRRKDAAYLRGFLEKFRQQNHFIGFAYANEPPPTSQYSDLIDRILKHCSAIQFRYDVWFKLNNSPSYQQLHGDKEEGDFTFEHAPSGVSATQLLPSQRSQIKIKVGETDGGKAGLTLTQPGKIPLRAKDIDTPKVPAGKHYIQSLHFELDDVAKSLNVKPPPQDRTFQQLLQFSLLQTGAMEGSAGDNSALERIDENSAVWMGGFREKTSSLPLSIRRVWLTPLALFPTSLATKRYEVVPAAVGGTKALNHSGIWHFSEGGASCYVDTQREPDNASSSARTLIYPSAWLSGGRLLQTWYGIGHLPAWHEQFDDFGVRDLPAVGKGAVSDADWNKDPGIANGRGAFDNRMPHSGYWWEICFHVPLAIADQLSRQQRFQDADRWLRMVFDPLTSTTADPQAFLRFRRFRELPRALGVRSDLNALARAAAATNADPSPTVQRVEDTITRWKSQPFRPFVIARRRHIAFLWRTLFAYLDNLMAWADSLYRRETRESIQEAVLLYVQVARLLGPRPRRTRRSGSRPAASFVEYQDQWDDFANRWINALPATPSPTAPVMVDSDEDAPVEGMLYFCVPPNDTVIRYWDVVEERLTNIRHCRNIEGVERSLPIEAPEIDLEELLRAVASGTSPEQFVADAFAQPWPYRYGTLLAHAKELVNDVRNLGAQLLVALEKRDSEQLALLRSTHELALLEQVTEVRQQQVTEAERQVDALLSSREAVAARYEQLLHQMGKEGARAPARDEFAGTESRLGRLSTGNQHAQSNLGLLTQEADQLEQLHFAHWWTDADSAARLVAWGFNSGSAIASFFSVFEQGVGGSTKSEKVAKALGALGSAASSTADGFKAIAQIHQTQSSRLAQTASNIRRRDDWAFQSNTALRELATIDKQLKASEARLEIVRKEFRNHLMQREHAQATDVYLRDKFTNAALYRWQSAQLLSLYRSTYGLATAQAQRARRAAGRELGRTSLPRIGTSHWEAGRNGLMAAERLQREIKLLELAVLEQHTRDAELTRHISLRRLNPRALIDLIATGRGEFEIPEWLFDLDAPGHYLRRIKSVSVTIPCVTGPYTSMNARLTLLRSDTRIEPAVNGDYLPLPDGDSRFETRFHAGESIFLSTGRDDTGLFETNLRDERYLPFEGAGAASAWRIEFPGDVEQFDRSTISDVIIHLRYTARDAGQNLADAARASLKARWSAGKQAIDVLLSMRIEFSAEWTRATQGNALSLDIDLDTGTVLPYWMLAAGITKLSTAQGPDVLGLRQARAGDEPSIERIAGVTLQAGKLRIPAPPGGGWTGLRDMLVVASTTS